MAGLGVAVLPCIVGESEANLVRVWKEVLTSDTLYMVVHPEIHRVARVRAVVDALVSLITTQAGALRGTRSA